MPKKVVYTRKMNSLCLYEVKLSKTTGNRTFNMGFNEILARALTNVISSPPQKRIL